MTIEATQPHVRTPEQVSAVARENVYAGLGVAMVALVIGCVAMALTDGWRWAGWLGWGCVAIAVATCGILHAARFGGDDAKRFIAYQELLAERNEWMKVAESHRQYYTYLESLVEALQQENGNLKAKVLNGGNFVTKQRVELKSQVRMDCENLLRLWNEGAEYKRDAVVPGLMSRDRWDAAMNHLAMLDMVQITNRQRYINAPSMGVAMDRLDSFEKRQDSVGENVVLGG